MKADLSRCSLVFVGAWNQAIFQPDWVSKRVLDGRGVALEILFSDAGMLVRFEAPEAALLVGGAQVQLNPHRLDEPTLRATEAMASVVLEALPETPIRAFGINFAYLVAVGGRAETELSRAELPDVPGRCPKVKAIHRSMPIDGAVFNVTFGRFSETTLALDFNEHYACPSGRAKGAREQLNGRVVAAHQRATEVASLLYGEKEEA